ncbi:MAG: MFS transporter [Thermodesulfobacteriota bacterium]|nr:MFS transporter [Thermodesulfobacteriota bacterium]
MRIRILSVLCISTLAAMMGFGILLPILPIYARDMGASGAMLGIIFSSFAVTMAISNPIVGRISDRFGYKRILAAGLGLHVPVMLLYVYASAPWHLICIRLVEGILSAMVETVAMAYVGSIAPKDREGSYMGIFNTFLFMGFGIGPLVGGYLADAYTIHMPFYATAGFLFLAFCMVMSALPSDDSSDVRPDSRPGVQRIAFKDVWGSNLIKGMLFFSLVLALGESGLMTFLPILVSDAQISTTRIGILTSAIMISAGIFQYPFGRLANHVNKVFLVITGVLIVAVVLAFVPLCTTFNAFLFLSVVGGIGTAMSNPAAMAILVRESKDTGLGFILGLYNLGMGIGMIAGPILAGVTMDTLGIDKVFVFSSILFVLASLVIYGYTRDIRNTL